MRKPVAKNMSRPARGEPPPSAAAAAAAAAAETHTHNRKQREEGRGQLSVERDQTSSRKARDQLKCNGQGRDHCKAVTAADPQHAARASTV
eukprot:COSAG05_NODE_19344_length_294_cov_0.789744_1_plen_90_part_01